MNTKFFCLQVRYITRVGTTSSTSTIPMQQYGATSHGVMPYHLTWSTGITSPWQWSEISGTIPMVYGLDLPQSVPVARFTCYILVPPMLRFRCRTQQCRLTLLTHCFLIGPSMKAIRSSLHQAVCCRQTSVIPPLPGMIVNLVN